MKCFKKVKKTKTKTNPLREERENPATPSDHPTVGFVLPTVALLAKWSTPTTASTDYELEISAFLA